MQRGEDATAQLGSSFSSAPINASSSSGRASNKRALEAQHASKLDELTALRAKAKRLGDSRGMQGERRAIKLERAADTLEQQVRGRLASPDMHDARGRSMTETYGRAGLVGEAAEKVMRGNELALDMVGQIKDIIKAGHFSLWRILRAATYESYPRSRNYLSWTG